MRSFSRDLALVHPQADPAVRQLGGQLKQLRLLGVHIIMCCLMRGTGSTGNAGAGHAGIHNAGAGPCTPGMQVLVTRRSCNRHQPTSPCNGRASLARAPPGAHPSPVKRRGVACTTHKTLIQTWTMARVRRPSCRALGSARLKKEFTQHS